MQTPSERDPLLANPLPSQDTRLEAPVVTESKKQVGPLEITSRNKYAILGGIWVANFLGVGGFTVNSFEKLIFLTEFGSH
jgi:hypothetical protein